MSAIIEAQLVSSPMLVPRESDLPPLTIREAAFVRHWLNPDNLRNGTRAAELAGYSGDENTLAVIASQNLRKLHIQAHIQHAIKARHISPDQIIAELSEIAILPAKDLQTPSKPDQPYSAHHKLKALETCAKISGILDKPEQNTSLTINVERLDLSAILTQLVQGVSK